MEREELLNTGVENVVKQLRQLAKNRETKAMLAMMGRDVDIYTKAADCLEAGLHMIQDAVRERAEELKAENDQLRSDLAQARRFTEELSELQTESTLRIGELEAMVDVWRVRATAHIQAAAAAEEAVEKAVETVEANILASIGDGGKSCHWCREKTYAQGMKDAAEIVEGFGETEIAEVIYAAIGKDQQKEG